jgi:hypothetical protein
MAGAILSPGSGSWSNLSDLNSKANFRPVDQRRILESLVSIPITEWNYISQDESIRHIGPMAQDFFTTFNIGEVRTHINTVDANGVTFASIQGLYQMVSDQEFTITQMERKIMRLEKQINVLIFIFLLLMVMPSTIMFGYIRRMKHIRKK